MKEARIECLAKEFPLHDLGLQLRKGQVVWLEESKARGSKELEAARRINAVQVRYVQRSRMAKKPEAVRPPPPPNVRLARRPPPSPAPAVDPGDRIDLDEIRRIAREEAREGAREGVQEALASLPSSGGGVDQATLEAALRNVLGGTTTASPAQTTLEPRKGPDEPVYIPTNIVDSDAKTDIKTSTTEDDAGDLGDAAAALKAAKGTRTPRKKKTTEKK